MTEQEIFDKAARHLLTQKEKSFLNNRSSEEYGICVYRGPNNLQCAFGPFIPDELYDESIEGMDATGVIEKLELTELYEHTGFCIAIQRIHDDWTVPFWREELINLAVRYNLSPARSR